MSFTSEIKNECAAYEFDDCCKKAQLAALLQILSSLSISSDGLCLVFKVENASVAKKTFKLLKDIYNVDTQLSVIKKMNLNKNNIYSIKVKNKAREILKDLKILTDEGLSNVPDASLYQSDCCERAFVAGAFLASGSCNSPKTSNYHLEIACNSLELSLILEEILNRYSLNAKHITRRNQYVTYIKSSDKISEFLKLIQTTNAMFEFEDARVQRDMYNNISRLNNCEIANEMKIINSASIQIEEIELIENYVGLDILNSKLLAVAKLRKKFPESSLNELCDEFYEEYNETISKSGMRHRLGKISEIAKSYRNM